MTAPLRYQARVAQGLSVEFTYDGQAGVGCEWDPEVPAQLSAQAARTYAAARLKFWQRIASYRGEPVALVTTVDGAPAFTVLEPAPAGTA